jgi:aliphatic nitrilase
VNATGWLDESQVAQVAKGSGLESALRGGCHTAIVSPEGKLLCEPLTEGEGIVYAELDFDLITKRKRMMDSVGHYARPELLSLALDSSVKTPLRESLQPLAAPRPRSEDGLQPDGGSYGPAASFGAANS